MSVRQQHGQGPSHRPQGWEGAEQAEGKGRTEVRWRTGEKGSSKQLCKVMIPRKHGDRRAKSEWLAKEMRTRLKKMRDAEIAQKVCNGRLGKKIGGGQWKETAMLDKNLGKG